MISREHTFRKLSCFCIGEFSDVNSENIDGVISFCILYSSFALFFLPLLLFLFLYPSS